MSTQYTQRDDAPWRDKEILKQLYIEEKMSSSEIGDELGVSPSTVVKWLHKNDIPTRKPVSERLLCPGTTKQGYVMVRTTKGGEPLTAAMHRLLAVSEYGFEAIEDKIVHHKNKIPWDNRPDNIELTTQSEHAKHHVRNEDVASKLTKENVREIRERYPDDCTLTELANKFDVALSTVYSAYNGTHFSWVD